MERVVYRQKLMNEFFLSGEITLALNQTQLTGMHVAHWDRAQLIPLPDDDGGDNKNTLLLKAEGISVDASSRWRWWKGPMHSHGLLTVSVVDCSVTARVHLARNGRHVVCHLLSLFFLSLGLSLTLTVAAS